MPVMQGGRGSNNVSSVVYDAETDTAYNFLTILYNGDNGRITKTTNVSGSPSTTELVSTAAWFAASFTSQLYAGSGAGLVEDAGDPNIQYLQFAEVGSDAIWRVRISDGVIIEYVSKSAIMAYTGESTVKVLSSHTAYGGEHYFYDGQSNGILKTTGPNSVVTFVSAAQIDATTGYTGSDVKGGLTFDGNGLLIFSSNGDPNGDGNGLYRWDPNTGTGTQLLSKAQLIAAASVPLTKFTFNDIYYAPDGWVYMNENTADDIIKFNPDAPNPADTLTTVLTGAEIAAGPIGAADAAGQFQWYDGGIAWHTISNLLPMANKGLYAMTMYSLTLYEVNGHMGQVAFDPTPDDANAPRFGARTEVTLTAVPNAGKSFKEWEIFDPNYPGDDNHAVKDTNNPIVIVMDTDRQVEVAFKCGSGVDEILPLLVVCAAWCCLAGHCRRRGK